MRIVTHRTYKLDELAHAAGTSVRTIRYYVQRGLLPAPQFRGKDTSYAHEHLMRLRAIKRLQDAYLPLDAIAAELARRSPEEIERLADGKDLPKTASSPKPPPRAEPVRSEFRTWHRVEIAPGIELSVADDAPVHSREIFERAVTVLEAMKSVKEGEEDR
ncbi:MAG TPA: MerR family transcriptional regulator [Labilithrix sp.]